MARQIVMDATGDTRIEFDPTDATAVAQAVARFKELTGAGFTAAVRRGPGHQSLCATSTFLPMRRFSFPDCEAVSEICRH